MIGVKKTLNEMQDRPIVKSEAGRKALLPLKIIINN
jgi:hypothetical protein